MSAENVQVVITPSRIDASISDSLAAGTDGAVVIFQGIVRDNTEGEPVTALEYEAYDEMASEQMRLIGEEARSRWEIGRVLLVHRTGRLSVGEASVLVAVAAPHRGAAFDACEFCIDTLKDRVPIWKKELFASGDSHWVDHP